MEYYIIFNLQSLDITFQWWLNIVDSQESDNSIQTYHISACDSLVISPPDIWLPTLTLSHRDMLLVANWSIQMMQKTWKVTETLVHGYSARAIQWIPTWQSLKNLHLTQDLSCIIPQITNLMVIFLKTFFLLLNILGLHSTDTLYEQ